MLVPALTPALAFRLLDAGVIQAPFNHHLACTYRSTAHPDTISLILTLTGPGTAPARNSCSTASTAFGSEAKRPMVSHPSPPTRPEQAGTLSVLKGNTLVLIAVRQSSDPQATARQAMTAILPGL